MFARLGRRSAMFIAKPHSFGPAVFSLHHGGRALTIPFRGGRAVRENPTVLVGVHTNAVNYYRGTLSVTSYGFFFFEKPDAINVKNANERAK